jgi:hypothetical protein
MSDRVFLTLIVLAAAAMIGLSAIWPQGLGARSPGPFGHPPVLETPAMQAAMAREAAKAQAKLPARRAGPAGPARPGIPPQTAEGAGLRDGQ